MEGIESRRMLHESTSYHLLLWIPRLVLVPSIVIVSRILHVQDLGKELEYGLLALASVILFVVLVVPGALLLGVTRAGKDYLAGDDDGQPGRSKVHILLRVYVSDFFTLLYHPKYKGLR